MSGVLRQSNRTFHRATNCLQPPDKRMRQLAARWERSRHLRRRPQRLRTAVDLAREYGKTVLGGEDATTPDGTQVVMGAQRVCISSQISARIVTSLDMKGTLVQGSPDANFSGHPGDAPSSDRLGRTQGQETGTEIGPLGSP